MKPLSIKKNGTARCPWLSRGASHDNFGVRRRISSRKWKSTTQNAAKKRIPVSAVKLAGIAYMRSNVDVWRKDGDVEILAKANSLRSTIVLSIFGIRKAPSTLD